MCKDAIEELTSSKNRLQGETSHTWQQGSDAYRPG